jgi:hypothetical protein
MLKRVKLKCSKSRDLWCNRRGWFDARGDDVLGFFMSPGMGKNKWMGPGSPGNATPAR